VFPADHVTGIDGFMEMLRSSIYPAPLLQPENVQRPGTRKLLESLAGPPGCVPEPADSEICCTPGTLACGFAPGVLRPGRDR
jgi:hypothetical protein